MFSACTRGIRTFPSPSVGSEGGVFPNKYEPTRFSQKWRSESHYSGFKNSLGIHPKFIGVWFYLIYDVGELLNEDR